MKAPLLSIYNPRLPVLCLLCAWLVGVIGLALGLFVDGSWFGRFGSLVVLFALIGEFALLKSELFRLYQRLSDESAVYIRSKDFSPSRWHAKKSVALHMTIVVGTIIWGFGDVLL